MFKFLMILFVLFLPSNLNSGKSFVPRKHISTRSHRFIDHHRTFVTLRQRKKLKQNDEEN